MAIAIDANNIVFSNKSASSSSSRSNSTSISSDRSSVPSSVSRSVPYSPSPSSLPSMTVSSYSSSTSSMSSTGSIKDESRSIPEMLFNLPSVLVKNMIQGTMYLVNNFINYLPYSIVNPHHGITINFWFQFHSLVCPFRSRFTMKKMAISSSSLSPCSSCSNGQTNDANLPDVIPINDSTRRSNVHFKCSSTLIIDVGSTLRDVSNKFNSNHLGFT